MPCAERTATTRLSQRSATSIDVAVRSHKTNNASTRAGHVFDKALFTNKSDLTHLPIVIEFFNFA